MTDISQADYCLTHFRLFHCGFISNQQDCEFSTEDFVIYTSLQTLYWQQTIKKQTKAQSSRHA